MSPNWPLNNIQYLSCSKLFSNKIRYAVDVKFCLNEGEGEFYVSGVMCLEVLVSLCYFKIAYTRCWK